MNKTRKIALLFAMMVFGFCVYGQAISITVGTGDYYSNVGDYDYLPYSYNSYPGQQMGQMSFQATMGQYGTWASMQPFGQVWRPYVGNDWRPYTDGHWSYTQYGPTWVGYEPWAWAGYHYGNWAFSQQMGWVWVPGYEWHPGRVAWSQGYNSIGWMPMPPAGYDYSRGYLGYAGPQNQFTYYDDDFSIGVGFGGNDYYYGGPYYDPRYRNMYYNNSFLNLVGTLFTFIDPNNFGRDNYNDYYYGGDYARYLFDRRLIRISSRPIDRVFIERVTRQPVQVRQVRTNQIQVDGRPVRIVAVEGEQESIRKNANRTVREVIAPAFAEKGKEFKGEKARNRAGVKKALNLEGSQERVETITSDEIVRQARQKNQQKEQQRAQIRESKRQEVAQVERQGKFKERKDRGVRQTQGEDSKSSRVTPGTENRRDATEQENLRRNESRPENVRRNNERTDTDESENVRRNQNRPERTKPEQEDQEKIRRNRPDDVQENRERNRPAPDDDNRLKDRDEKSNVRPDTDEDVRRNDPDRSSDNSEVSKDDNENRKNAESKSDSKKAKSKNTKSKDKDKKQNDDEKPPEE